jgi:hypothetical protein
MVWYLTRATAEGLAEHQDLELIVDGQDTSTGDTTENVGTSTVEEGADTAGSDDLAGSVEGRLVLDGLTGGHHHTTTDGVEGVGSDTGTSGDSPSEGEVGQEVALKTLGQERLDGVVHAEVETTVDNDTGDGGHETTVETGNTIGGNGLAVDVNETVELTGTTSLGVLGVVGQTGTGEVKGVDEKHRSGTSSTTGSQVTGHPPGVTVTLLLEAKQLLELVLEGEVQGLGREVTDDVGSVTTPQRESTLIGDGALEAVTNTGVAGRETARLDHLILVLDQKLDTLNGSGGGLRDGGGNTTHWGSLSVLSIDIVDVGLGGIVMTQWLGWIEVTYSGSRPRRAARKHCQQTVHVSFQGLRRPAGMRWRRRGREKREARCSEYAGRVLGVQLMELEMQCRLASRLAVDSATIANQRGI